MAALIQIFAEMERAHELGATNTLGRDESNHIPLTDPLVSRNHAEIRQTPEGRFRLVDLGSTHGTFVAGERVNETLLNDGDEVIIGSTRFRFEDTDSSVSRALEVGISVEATQPYVQQLISVDDVVSFPEASKVRGNAELRKQYEKLGIDEPR